MIYTVPSIDSDTSFAVDSGTEYDVEVVGLTPETAAAANIAPFVPPRLPLAFQPDAVERASRAVPRLPELTPLPEPTVLPERRPSSIADRFPPLLDPQPYRIGVGDALVLAVTSTAQSVEALPGLITAQAKRNDYVVQDDGAIAIPDVGRVRVAGLSIQDAEAAIFQALVGAGIDPSFSLEIAEFNSQRVTVGGEVAQPSLVPITLKPLYLHEAVQLAGGPVSPEPAVAKVQLIRRGEIYQIGLERFRTDPAVRRVLLRDGDSVLVTSEYRQDVARTRFQQELTLRQQRITTTDFELRQRELEQQARRDAQAELEAERALFRERLELGAVERPRAYLTGEIGSSEAVPLPFERSATLADVLFGDTRINARTSDFGEIYVLRAETDPSLEGGLTAFHLNGDNAANLMTATRLELRPNDVVFVSAQPVTSWNRVISQILPNLLFRAVNVADGGL